MTRYTEIDGPDGLPTVPLQRRGIRDYFFPVVASIPFINQPCVAPGCNELVQGAVHVELHPGEGKVRVIVFRVEHMEGAYNGHNAAVNIEP